jgi:RNA polymerase sigma-70 factor (ECF subfamily)
MPEDTMDAPDHELIAMGKLGDSMAIGQLFARYYQTSLNIARRMLRSESESEDAVQAAYCSAFQHFDAFRGDASFKTWITRIVMNCCLMILREPWRRHTQSSPELFESRSLREFASQSPSPEKTAWCREVAEAHDNALAQLPTSLRSAYTMYAVAGMPVAQVASTLGLSRTAAKSRLFRARSVMRSSLGNVWCAAGANR